MVTVAHREGQLETTTTAQTAHSEVTPALEMGAKQENIISQWPSPLAMRMGFAEIAWSLHGDNPPEVIGIPLELAMELAPIYVVESMLFSAQLLKDTSRVMYIDMVMCQMRVMGMGLNPTADIYHIPTLKDLSDLDWVTVYC